MSLVITDGSTTITLPNPAIGNTDQNITGAVVIGEKMLKMAHWPNINRLRYQYNYLTRTEVEDCLTKITTLLGKQVTLTDHHGIAHTCILLNPNNVVIDNGPCKCSFTLEAEE